MVTNYPQQLTATAASRESSATPYLARAVSRVRQMVCGLRGHDSLMHFEARRVTMRCVACGHETPGWETAERGPRKRFDGDARRHVLTPTRLVLRKSA